MTIRENIQDVIDKMLQEQAAGGGHSATADEVQRKARAAITGGNASQAWRDYMMLYSDSPTNPRQLARLIPTDGTETNAAMQEARAYLVANGMLCGVATTDLTDNHVTNEFII
ncbi:MAG TPA: hypothetical protein VF546_16600 [Pyrinomonadaceae bacterium]|jgi:hypothetical protein